METSSIVAPGNVTYLPRRLRMLEASRRRVGWSLYEIAVVGMILTFVWRFQQLIPILSLLQLTSLTTGAAVLLFLLGRLKPAFLPRVTDPVFAASAFILFWMVVSVPFGIYPGLSFRFIFQDHAKTFLLMVLIVAAIRSVRDLERLLMVQIAAASYYCLFALSSVQVGVDGRFPGLVYYDANDFAMLIVCTLPFLLYFARPGSNPKLRAAATFAAIPFILTLIKTGSRGGFLGLLVVTGYLLFAFDAVPRKARALAVGLGLLMLVGFGGSQYWERMSTLLNPSEDYNWSGESETGRIEIWKRGFGYMLQKPITGVGPSAFFVAEGELSAMARLAELGVGFRWSAPHSSFVQIGAELGVIGLVSFLALLGAAFRSALKFARPSAPLAVGDASRRRALGQAFCASILGYGITALFISQAYAAFLYCMLGFLIGMNRIAASSSPRPRRALRRRRRIHPWRSAAYALRPPAPGADVLV